MTTADAKRMKQLERENAGLKKLAADQAPDIAVLRDVNSKNFYALCGVFRLLLLNALIERPLAVDVAFETAIMERYQRRESSVEEALIGMYLAEGSVRRAEDITEVLWDTKVSTGTISNFNKKVFGHIEEWRNRPLRYGYPYVGLDGVYLKRNRGGEYENVTIPVAMTVNKDGYREVIGTAEGMKEDTES